MRQVSVKQLLAKYHQDNAIDAVVAFDTPSFPAAGPDVFRSYAGRFSFFRVTVEIAIPRKGERPSINLGDDTNFFAQFECAPLSSIIRRGVCCFEELSRTIQFACHGWLSITCDCLAHLAQHL